MNKDSSMIEITPAVLGVALLIGSAVSLAAWCWLVLHRFAVPEPQWLVVAGELRHAWAPQLRWTTMAALAVGFGPVALFLHMVGHWGPADKIVVRGARLVKVKALAAKTRLKQPKGQPPIQVEIASVPIPPACEPSHFLLVGSTNTGKSTAIDELLAGAIARGDRLIVIDPNGHALSRFGKQGDKVLNPFDKRSPGWSPFNEIRTSFDYERVAASIVPDSNDASAQQWHGYARQLLAETMRVMMQAGQNTSAQLLHWLNQESAANLAQFLVGTAASGLFVPGAEKALASTRFILATHLSVYQHLKPGCFSLRKWLDKGQGNLYIMWREDMLSSLKPLVSSWADILVAQVLTLPVQKPKPLWLFLDELASLEHLSSLEAGLTKGRKHGLRVVAGLQSVAQLDAIYGSHAATTLRSCFRNMVALGCASSDPQTAQIISEGLGTSEIERTVVTSNTVRGREGETRSRNVQHSVEPLVLPSQLTSLPPLHGYLKLAGDYPVAEIVLKPVDRPVRVKAFERC